MRTCISIILSITALVGCTEEEQVCADELQRDIDELIEIVNDRSIWTDEQRAEAIVAFSRLSVEVDAVLSDADRNACDYRIHGANLVLEE